jgi:hypothetical protein
MQWGRNDQSVTANSTTTKETSNGAPIGTYALVRGGQTGTANVSFGSNAHFGNTSSGSRASVDVNMYGNTTMGAFVNNMAVGVFAVNSSMLSTTGGGIQLGYVTFGGSGYASNAAVTLTVTNGGSGATANATVSVGRVTTLNANQAGSGYVNAPSVAIAAPAAINVDANTTGVNSSAGSLLVSTANSKFLVGDQLTYTVPTGNTAIPGLTGNTSYYVAFSNTSAIVLSATSGGANISITANASTTQVHTIQGQTATGYFDVSSAYPQVTHSGWVIRREGTGGRAGRVTYETLVAMGSLGTNTVTSTGVVGNIDTVTSNSSVDSIV